jgi:hypothetical protein
MIFPDTNCACAQKTKHKMQLARDSVAHELCDDGLCLAAWGRAGEGKPEEIGQLRRAGDGR